MSPSFIGMEPSPIREGWIWMCWESLRLEIFHTVGCPVGTGWINGERIKFVSYNLYMGYIGMKKPIDPFTIDPPKFQQHI